MHILIAWAHTNSTGESDGNLWKLRSPTIFPCILNRVFKCLNLHYHVYLLKPSKSKTKFTIFPLNIYPSEFPYCVLVIPCFAALRFPDFLHIYTQQKSILFSYCVSWDTECSGVGQWMSGCPPKFTIQWTPICILSFSCPFPPDCQYTFVFHFFLYIST